MLARYEQRKYRAYRWECIDCEAWGNANTIPTIRKHATKHTRDEGHEVLVVKVLGDVVPC